MPSCKRCGDGPYATAELRRSPKGDGTFLCFDKAGCKNRRKERRAAERAATRARSVAA